MKNKEQNKKNITSIKHDYKYYCDLMGKNNFIVFEEEGQIYIAQKLLGIKKYLNINGIMVSYLKMQNRKTPSCVNYSDAGAKKLDRNTIKDILSYEYNYDKRYILMKETCENTIDQLLGNKQLLEKTEIFKNLIPTLEKAKEVLNNCTLSEDDQRIIRNMYYSLSYTLSPVGQKDKVNEEFVKEKGLENGISAKFLLQSLGDFDTEPNFRKKTPYGQVGLTKTAYYNLKKLI